jgi:prepilin-type N-terminal cleavage/methylation domain-containing protein
MIPPRRSSPAFTLVELTVVILIIAVLVALSFTGISAAQNAARKAQVKNDIGQIITAVKGYYGDYGAWPLNSVQAGAGSDTVYGDPGGTYSSADLFNILRAIADTSYNVNNQLNPKGIIYFNAKDVKNAATPRGGFATAAATSPTGKAIKKGAYVDPWGAEYVVWIDGDYNNDLTTKVASSYSDLVSLQAGVADCSLGRDGKFGRNGNGILSGSDDVTSWP